MNNSTLLGLFAVCSLAMGCASAYRLGGADARRTLVEGHLELETYGLQPGWNDRYEMLLLNRYGVKTRGVAGCISDHQTREHARGYNEVMSAEVERRFGPDVWERTEREARGLNEKPNPN